jgi:hypothetical protein
MSTSKRWIHKFQIKNNVWVFVPNNESRLYGNKIKSNIDKKWKKPSYYYHFRDGGHVAALKSHINNTFFIHADIQNFFGAINKSRVTRNLKSFFGYKIAREIAEKSTVQCPHSNVKEYVLPFGFVQSPILASFCLHKSRLGVYLDKLYESGDFKVSVYMDDIIISGKNLEYLKEILVELNRISDHSGFQLNQKKTQVSSNITPFNIELSHKVLKISTDRMTEFILHYTSGGKYRRIGILCYISTINKKQLKILSHLVDG